MLIGAAYAALNTRALLAHTIRTEGKVVALQPRHPNNSPSTNAPLTYAPLIRFTHAGQVIDFSTATATNPPTYHIGDVVPVLYDESTSKSTIYSFFTLWARPIIVGTIGVVFLLIGGLWIRRTKDAADIR
jgi:hypothetical protein